MYRPLLATVLAPALATAALVAPGAPVHAGPPAHASGHPRPHHAPDVQVQQNATTWSVSWDAPGRHQVFASTDPRDPSRSGRLVGSAARGTLEVSGLSRDRRWYFEVASQRQVQQAGKKPARVRGVIASSRSLDLDSTSNTRDLGGMRTSDGRSVRWGVLFRSDAVVAPTARDSAILQGLNLATSADFRAEPEIVKDGANQYPAGVRQLFVPLLDDSTTALSEAIQAVLRGGDPAVAHELLGDGKAEQIAATGPSKMISRPAVRAAFSELLRELANGGTPMIFNCTAGKDRTGVFAAVVQRLLGVPEKTVLADYELSNQYRAAYNERTYAFLQSVGVDPALLRPLMEQSGANLANMFRSVEREYGSFDAFVRDGLGLDKSTVKALRAQLLVG